MSLNGLKWILCAVANAGVRVGARDKWHLLANGDKRFFVIQCQQARRGQDVSVALCLQRVENKRHRQGLVDHTPAQRSARNLCQGACNRARPNIFRAVIRHNGICNRTVARLLGRTGADVTAIQSAVVGEQPLESKLLPLRHLHFDDDGLDEHLRPSDIEPRDHCFECRHLVGIRRDDQAIRAGIGFYG